MFKYRGHRIRKIDSHALTLFFILSFLPFLAVAILPFIFMKDNLIVKTIISVVIVIVAVVGILYFINWDFKRRGFIAKLKQRQMLARMILSNKYYETKKGSGEKSKQKIVMPKVYYRYNKKKYITDITFPADGGRLHDRFLKMGKVLEEMFIADLVGTEREVGFVDYQMLIDVIGNRYTIDQVNVTGSQINLMKGTSWNWDSDPHMLISGGTGGGKTYFIFTLIYKLEPMAVIDICDPKKADLADLADIENFKGHVYISNDQIEGCLRKGVEDMEQRYAYMKQRKDYVTGKNYAYYKLPPHFIIVDEWAAFISTLDFQASDKILNYVKQLILKGRQAGVELIIATQRADAQNFGGGIRDNMMFKVTLGQLTALGYDMVFGDDNKNKSFINKGIRGRGYHYSSSDSAPSEFYSALVPKDFDFIAEFKKLPKMPEIDYTIENSNEINNST